MVIIQFGLISSLFLIGLLNALPTSKLSNETQSAYYDYDQFNLEEGEFPSDDYYYSHDHIFEKIVTYYWAYVSLLLDVLF